VRCTGPVGRGTDRVAEAERPLVSDGENREVVPLLGGLGTLRFMAICEFSFLAAPFAYGLGALPVPLAPRAADEFALKLCGGRGTYLPAGAGVRAKLLLFAPLCAAKFWFPRSVELPLLRVPTLSLARAVAARDAAGGVIRLTVEREKAAEDGLAEV
jgi:hypothetical protein